MLQQSWPIEIVVPRTIGHLTAYGCARKRTIVCVLPTHLEWREVPVVTTRNAGTVGIRLLVTTGAIQTRYAFPLGTAADDLRAVTVPVVALPGLVSGSVTGDAAR